MKGSLSDRSDMLPRTLPKPAWKIGLGCGCAGETPPLQPARTPALQNHDFPKECSPVGYDYRDFFRDRPGEIRAGKHGIGGNHRSLVGTDPLAGASGTTRGRNLSGRA